MIRPQPFARMMFGHLRKIRSGAQVTNQWKRWLAVGKEPIKTIKVDASALGQESLSRLTTDFDSSGPIAQLADKEPMTPLGQELQDYIKISGPITLHEYMSQAANHLVHGYYQHDNKKIGEKGDFITAPEISQLFGEILAVWCIATWEELGCPKKLRIIELGPGNGTLMKDLLRTLNQTKKISNHAQVEICLVELSDSLREVQQRALGCDPNSVEKNEHDKSISAKASSGTTVHWYKFIQQIPKDESTPCLFIGQEFLDAFPVHQFVQTKKGWREKLVDVDLSPNTPYHFRTVIASMETPAVKALLQAIEGSDTATKLFVDTSRTKKSNKKTSAGINSKSPTIDSEVELEQNGVEVSPRALAVCESVANIISRCRGAALFVDYGEDYSQGDSVRAFKNHNQVHILSEPGLADVTADVDFSMCARVSARQPNIRCWPVFTQGRFLLHMGITDRVAALIENAETTEEQAEELLIAYKRLVGSHLDSSTYMGSRFKVLSFSHSSIKSPGFQ